MGWTSFYPCAVVCETAPFQLEKHPKDNHIPHLASIGVDFAKDVFHFVGFSVDGQIALCRKIKRLTLVETFKKLPTCIVGTEACLSAHFVSRFLRHLGHEPRIIPAISVKAFL